MSLYTKKLMQNCQGLQAKEKHKHDSEVEITAWAETLFLKQLLVETDCHSAHKYTSKKAPEKQKHIQTKGKCLFWACTHLKCTGVNRIIVLWLDKSKFESLFGNKHSSFQHKRLERGDNTAYYQHIVQKPESVMEWVCISTHQTGD